jgi:hypothetical protein
MFYQAWGDRVVLAFACKKTISKIRMHLLVSCRLAAVSQCVMCRNASTDLAFDYHSWNPSSIPKGVADKQICFILGRQWLSLSIFIVFVNYARISQPAAIANSDLDPAQIKKLQFLFKKGHEFVNPSSFTHITFSFRARWALVNSMRDRHDSCSDKLRRSSGDF